MPLDWWDIRGSGNELISTVHVKDYKIETHFAGVVEDNLGNCGLIIQLTRQKNTEYLNMEQWIVNYNLLHIRILITFHDSTKNPLHFQKH